ncbi:hypothetical protein ACFE04_009790 [Oxalis oulophora]
MGDNKMVEEYEVRDRLSALPDSILLEILSFLPLRHVMKQSVLSKRWKHVCSQFPILDFNFDFFSGDDIDFWKHRDNFYYDETHSNHDKILKTQRKMRELFRVVDRMLNTLRTQSLNVKKFEVQMPLLDRDWANNIDRWIEHVVLEGNIKQLRIYLHDDNAYGVNIVEVQYDLSPNIFISKSLVELQLGFCSLQSLPIETYLPSLKELALRSIKVNDDVIQNLIAGCRNLEKLAIARCYGLKRLDVIDHLKLKKLKIVNNTKLECIKIKGIPNMHTLAIGSLDLIDKNFQLTRCENLRDLYIRAPIKTDCLNDLLAKIPFLEKLSLGSCKELKCVTISGDSSLKSMIIQRCYKLKQVTIDTPNLREFKYWGNIIDLSIVKCIPSVLFRIERLRDHNNMDDDLWYSKHIQLLQKLNQSCSNFVRLIPGNQGKNLNFPLHLREATQQPLLSHMRKLHCRLEYFCSNIGEIIDSLLCICSHPEIISLRITGPNAAKYDFLFSYKESIAKGEEPGCNKFLSASCRRHCLKDIKIEKFRSLGSEKFRKVDFIPVLLQDVELKTFLELIKPLSALGESLELLALIRAKGSAKGWFHEGGVSFPF